MYEENKKKVHEDSETSFLLDHQEEERDNTKKRISSIWFLVLAIVATVLYFTFKGGDDVKVLVGASSSPHIVFFMADDQGWNDIGYQSTDFNGFTPTIDSLASSGITLSRYYAYHVCTPSRASLMTGLFPSSIGMMHGIITGDKLYGLPLDLVTMPQIMKDAGYNTLMIGKWHLGHFTDSHLPLARGFDDFYGYFSGYQDHFTHISEPIICEDECYYDLRYEYEAIDTTSLSDRAAYGPHLYVERFVDFINTYDTTQPLFTYYAETLVHSPIGAPDYMFSDFADLLDEVPNEDRRIFGAMIIFLDSIVGNISSVMQSRGMWDNTIFIYASDNGADPAYQGGGNNMPLRGRKSNFFEGGVRVPAFIYAPNFLPASSAGSTYEYMMHISDWLPTIVSGILGREDLLKDLSGAQSSLDGLDQWSYLLEGSLDMDDDDFWSSAPRSELFLGFDYLDTDFKYLGCESGSIIVKEYKLLLNHVNETWWPVPGAIQRERGVKKLLDGVPLYTFLFNIYDDPEERVDLSAEYPTRVEKLTTIFHSYTKNAVDSISCPVDDATGKAVQEVEGFITPWETDAATCAYRILLDGERGSEFYPSYLSGELP